jgi:hypothetical protein
VEGTTWENSEVASVAGAESEGSREGRGVQVLSQSWRVMGLGLGVSISV